jgi:hypothetical protein
MARQARKMSADSVGGDEVQVYAVLSDLNNGAYPAGSEIELTPVQAEGLLALGRIELAAQAPNE